MIDRLSGDCLRPSSAHTPSNRFRYKLVLVTEPGVLHPASSGYEPDAITLPPACCNSDVGGLFVLTILVIILYLVKRERDLELNKEPKIYETFHLPLIVPRNKLLLIYLYHRKDLVAEAEFESAISNL